MPMRLLWTMAFLMLAPSAEARADEIWSCSFVSAFSREPVSVTYRIVGQELTAIWATGTEENFRLVVNNRFGLVAVSSTAMIEPDAKQPTVSATMLVINRGTKEFSAATAITGQPTRVGQAVQGTCSQQ
jgi:hypothetical protein